MTAITVRPSLRAELAEFAVALRLGQVEGRRLLKHPAYLAGVALSLVLLLVLPHTETGTTTGMYLVWTSMGLYPVAAGAFLGGFTAALRSRRHGTEELFDVQPAGPRARTGAQLVAVVYAAAGGAALLTLAAMLHQLWEGTAVHYAEGIRPAVPTVLELAQGPALIAFLGVLAIAVARWVPSLLAVPVASVVLLFHFVTGSWGIGGTLRWFLPMTTHERAIGWVQVTPGSGYSIVSGFDVASMHRHVGYLAALTAMVAIVALLRHGRDRRLLLVAGLAAATATAFGVWQLP